MTSILLTGASGFIGFHTAVRLCGEGYKVFAPIRSGALQNDNVQRLKSKGVRIIEGDFFDQKILKQICSEKIDAVVHLAAIRGETDFSEEHYYKINVCGTEVLLEQAKIFNIPKFIYCSSVGVLGTIPQKQPAAADDNICPDNLYHKSKRQAEELALKYHNESMNVCILRPTITYGGGDDGFLPKLVSLVSKRRFVLINSQIKIHLLNVTSFAGLIIKLLQMDKLDGQSYIVADKEPVGLNDLVNKIYRIARGRDYPNYIKASSFLFRGAEAILKTLGIRRLLTSVQLISRSWTYDISKTEEGLGYQPLDTLANIQKTIEDELNAGK